MGQISPIRFRRVPLWMKLFRLRPLFVLCFIFFSSFLVDHMLRSVFEWPSFDTNKTLNPSDDYGSGRYWHLLVPATSSNPLLCSTLLTALVHSYPTPTLINWGVKDGDLPKDKELPNDGDFPYDGELPNDEDLPNDGDLPYDYDVNTGKVWGVLKFLNSLAHVHDNDMVLMIDGHDVWFQLRPEVLMERYQAVNKAANERLRKQFGSELVEKHNISQTIVFAAEKHCWPQAHNSPHCYAVPESPLARDVYGPNTDHGLKNNRPRFLNSGTIMGPVGDMRKLFQYVHEFRIEEPGSINLDQYYFGEVFGLQEFYRQKLRNSSEWIHTFEWFEPQDLSIPITPLVDDTEFHIGLDYKSSIFQDLMAAQDDIAFVRYDGKDDIYDMQDKLGIRPNRNILLPNDILSSERPASRQLSNANVTSLPNSNITNYEWRHVPLCTNFRSETIPVALHHNGDSSYLGSMWKKMWFQNIGREVLQRNTLAQEGPIVVGNSRTGGHSWWSMHEEKGGAWTDSGTWLSWKDLCSNHEADLFDI